MDTMNYIFGLVTLLAAAVTIQQYISSEKKKANEVCKVEVLRTRLDDIHNSLLPILYSIHRVTGWVAKAETLDRMGLYRNLRTLHVQTETIALAIQAERKRPTGWRFGLFTPSEFSPEEPDTSVKDDLPDLPISDDGSGEARQQNGNGSTAT
ncbi:MAG: hypothetical protein KKG33_15165 [candidate division Zixibacteria bacterium]|nr:hypothetical protein [candidate division Zixibacteria bacterium]MBU1471806.1 hypothetical protein [candidate division Zixibacteria bacterium]MBU2626892.1 hypothetical protein [candidate division Zixibacteria bacterium]